MRFRKMISGISKIAPGQIHKSICAVQRFQCNMQDFVDAFTPSFLRIPKVTPYGFKLAIGNSAHHRNMQAGSFEPDSVLLFKDFLQQTDVFVDVGANIGFYTCIARSQGKHVVAVEPQTKNLVCIYNSMLLNGWDDVEIFPLGLGSAPRIAHLYGISSTGASLISGWAGQPTCFRKTIPVSTLDILIGNRFSGKRLVIKIDVEGIEYDVLMGSKETMAMVPKAVWLVEICYDQFHPGGVNERYFDTFKLFWDAGYEARTANKENTLIAEVEIEQVVKGKRPTSGNINFVFLPR